MKYTEQQYLDCGFYGEGCEKDYSAKVVTLRKDRACVNCGREEKQGAKMFREKAVIEGEGRKTAYTCLLCLDKWLEATGQAPSVEADKRD